MKFSYKLSNVLGSVYHSGNLEFSSNGSQLLSPVGNKIVRYDLKGSSSSAIPIELEYNVGSMAMNPNSSLLLVSTERTQLYLYSLVSNRILHRKEFSDIGESINCIKFSSCGKYYIVIGSNKALIYITPGTIGSSSIRCLSPFMIHKVIKTNSEQITCCDFSSDSRLVVLGSSDMSIKVSSVDTRITNVSYIVNLSGHSDKIVSCYFVTSSIDSLDIISISANGHLIHWKSNMSTNGLCISSDAQNSGFVKSSDVENSENLETKNMDTEIEWLKYTKELLIYLLDHLDPKNTEKKKDSSVKLTVSDYNWKCKLLATGYTNGCFLINQWAGSVAELATPIYSLQLSSNSPLSSMIINKDGDWIAMASGINDNATCSNLVVWEWKSETFLMKQSGSGAGLVNLTEIVTFSPDSTILASGGQDGKIKLWNTFSGLNFATFGNEHRGPITDLAFVPNKSGKVLISSSLDGTVRAFDMGRYRNFRTFTSAPQGGKIAQFTCLAVDSISSDFIAAGAQNLYEIFLWSLSTGKLIEILSGHSGPVSGIAFSPNNSFLISTSWDSTLRIWDLFQGTKSCREVIKLNQPATGLAINLSGDQIAIPLLDGKIVFFNPINGEEINSGIDGKYDLGVSQNEDDISIDKAKHFSKLDYSADGNYIIAAGNSKYVCIYHIEEKLLVNKIAITWNLSMDGMYDYISKRKKAEFGFTLANLKSRDGDTDSTSIALPGVRKGDLSDRNVAPIIMVTSISFCPTMRSFAVSSTEGVLLYSLEGNSKFDPYQLEINITEDSVRESLENCDYSDALMQSLKLNQNLLITEILESIPMDQISFISASLSMDYVEKLLKNISSLLDSSAHVHFYLCWLNQLLKDHGLSIKSKHGNDGNLTATLRHAQKSIQKHETNIGTLVDYNKYFLKFMIESSHKETCENIDE